MAAGVRRLPAVRGEWLAVGLASGLAALAAAGAQYLWLLDEDPRGNWKTTPALAYLRTGRRLDPRTAASVGEPVEP